MTLCSITHTLLQLNGHICVACDGSWAPLSSSDIRNLAACPESTHRLKHDYWSGFTPLCLHYSCSSSTSTNILISKQTFGGIHRYSKLIVTIEVSPCVKLVPPSAMDTSHTCHNFKLEIY